MAMRRHTNVRKHTRKVLKGRTFVRKHTRNLKNLTTSQYKCLWNSGAFKPNADFDGDGYKNKVDCRPFDQNRDMSNGDLADKFANGATKGKGSHMFIEGDTIYSYGHHFPIAIKTDKTIDEKPVVIFNKNGYSSTTNRHKSYVRSALGDNFTVIENADIGIGNAEVQIDKNEIKISKLKGKFIRARTERSKNWYNIEIDDLKRQNRLLKIFSENHPENKHNWGNGV